MSKYDPKDLNGVMPAMITSINKDESINIDGLRKIINYLIAEKVNGLYITGSTGETFLMSPDEKKEVLLEAEKIYDVEKVIPSIYLVTELSRNKI